MARRTIHGGENHVYVRIRDITGRLANQGVWVKPHDVYRLGEAAET